MLSLNNNVESKTVYSANEIAVKLMHIHEVIIIHNILCIIKLMNIHKVIIVHNILINYTETNLWLH